MAKTVKKRRIIIMMILFAIIVVICVFGITFNPYFRLPCYENMDKSKLTDSERTINVYGKNGKLLADKLYDTDKYFVNVNDLPQYTPLCFIAIEDKRFYLHDGIDYVRILSAAKNNMLNGRFKEGASTITQQLVKNTHLNNEKTIHRKINEIRIAKEIEENYSKTEILENYLNILYFGKNTYGIGAAAERFFGKNACELSLSESALLAGIINNPTEYSPFYHFDNAIKRRNSVLYKMKNQNMISDLQYETAVHESIKISNKFKKSSVFLDEIISEACEKLEISKKSLFAGKYKIFTRYDETLGDYIDSLLDEYQIPEGFYEIVITDNKTGKCIGKYNDTAFSSLNLRRQPGSAIKPILCYAPALEKNLIYPISPIMDEKINYFGYSPVNFDNKYHGWISAREALINSYNIPAVKLLNMNGIEYSKNFAVKCGLSFDTNDTSLTLALGGMQYGLTLNELAESYMSLARGGSKIDMSFISSIYDKNGKCVYRPTANEYQVMREDTAYLITDMLKDCAVRGTAKRINSDQTLCVAAKTGTVGTKKGNSDAYCIAYTPDHTVAVRLSSKAERLLPNELSGGTVVSSIAGKIIRKINDKTFFKQPDNVVSVSIDKQEFDFHHKIVPANTKTPAKNKITALFSKYNIPYCKISRCYESELDNFDNFNIVDGFFDKNIDVR